MNVKIGELVDDLARFFSGRKEKKIYIWEKYVVMGFVETWKDTSSEINM